MSKSFDVKIIVTTRAVFGEKELDAIRETCKVVASNPPVKGKEGVHKALSEAMEKGDEAMAMFFIRAGLREQVKTALVDLYADDPVIRKVSPVTLEITPRG